MATTLVQLRSMVRGLVIDREESGIDPTFTDAEIDRAINAAKDDLFGRRPEAFCVDSLLTEPPADVGAILATSSDAIPVGIRSGLRFVDTGLTENGAAVYYDTMSTYARWTSTAYGIVITLIAEVGNESVADCFHNYASFVTVADTDTALDGEQLVQSTFTYGAPDYALGTALLYRVADLSWKLTYPAASDYWLNASTSQTPPLTLWGVGELLGNDAPTLSLTTPATPYGGHNSWSGDVIFAAETALVDVHPWAVITFCYGIASFLLAQRGKDAFYRKAADTLMKKYLGD